MSIKNNVKNAAKMLDKEFANWHKRIDLSKLSLMSFDNCILGQLYGDYMFAPDCWTNTGTEHYKAFGGHLRPRDQDKIFRYQQHWRKQIKKRQKNGVTSGV